MEGSVSVLRLRPDSGGLELVGFVPSGGQVFSDMLTSILEGFPNITHRRNVPSQCALTMCPHRSSLQVPRSFCVVPAAPGGKPLLLVGNEESNSIR